uniref:Uncharacterized protein n=1 Tax=Candidatus Kentrum sp. TC TaxID=2126339 RepID=A0A450Z0A4_9GAMM|nr:MAG: hypothetical protein BECKTC1821D_GA0114238_10431 [Candidatus Kentron sp. TC]
MNARFACWYFPVKCRAWAYCARESIREDKFPARSANPMDRLANFTAATGSPSTASNWPRLLAPRAALPLLDRYLQPTPQGRTGLARPAQPVQEFGCLIEQPSLNGLGEVRGHATPRFGEETEHSG